MVNKFLQSIKALLTIMHYTDCICDQCYTVKQDAWRDLCRLCAED